MIDGCYRITLKTPMGIKNGKLILKSTNGILSGEMSIMEWVNPLEEGTANENEFRFSGEIKTAVGKLRYDCFGNVDGKNLSGTVKTEKGDFAINGKRKKKLSRNKYKGDNKL